MSATDTPTQSTFQVNYLKSGDYREVACDGVIGGATPQGKLFIAFYAERLPIPRVAVFEADPPTEDRGLVLVHEERAPLYLESRDGLIRNLEFGMYVDIAAAKRLLSWLTARVEEHHANTAAGETK
jgi:hypothetical protein